MYNIKKNSCTKESFKFNKRGHLQKKQNTTYFQYNKYNKYKSRYNYSNKFSYNSYEYDYENRIFYEKEKNSEKVKNIKKKELIEVTESNNNCIDPDDNKESSLSYENSTANEYQYPIQPKTNEKSEDKSSIVDQDLNSSENNTIIIPNNSYCKTNSQICSDDKENIEPNIMLNNNNNNNNFNRFKSDSSYLNKNISSINLSSQEFKEAFYVPKRLNNLYNMYSNNNNNSNQINIKEGKDIGDNLQNSSMSKSSMSIESSLSFNNLFNNKNNTLQNNNNNNQNNIQNQNSNCYNLLLNNNIVFFNQNLNLNINNSQIIDQIQPFNLYDSNSSNPLRKMKSFDSFHSSLKSQISNSIFENEKEKENTDILEINVKISEKKSLIFKIRRYDDMFKTVKIFCEINKLDTKLIRPLIMYIIKALNSIYGIYNLNLKPEEIIFLKNIKNNFFDDDNNINNNNNSNESEKEDKQINHNHINNNNEDSNFEINDINNNEKNKDINAFDEY